MVCYEAEPTERKCELTVFVAKNYPDETIEIRVRLTAL